MNVPALRFKEFSGDWEEKTLGDITLKVGSGSTPRGGVTVYQSFGIPFIRSQNVNNEQLMLDDITFISEKINNQMKGSVVKPDDILLNITGASIGRSCVVPLNFELGNVNQHVCIIRLKPDYAPRFLQPYLSSSRGQKSISSAQVGSGREGLNFEAIRSFNISIPSLPEQTKIANFLTAVDEKISLLTQKATLLSQYKKGVMQQIFKQELRFKDDDGQAFPEWEEKTLGEVSDRVVRKNKEDNKNVLTISAQYGLINQQEYFNKSVAAKILTNYYLLHLGDFAYNKSYSNGYPMGAIKCLNRYEKGVVSTLYICFKFKSGFINKFFEQYFEAGLQNQEIEKVAQEGARNHGLLNIGLDDFFSIRLTIPSIPEQTKIANFLTAIDDKITTNQTQLNAVKQYKQGLLQQMFV